MHHQLLWTGYSNGKIALKCDLHSFSIWKLQYVLLHDASVLRKNNLIRGVTKTQKGEN